MLRAAVIVHGVISAVHFRIYPLLP